MDNKGKPKSFISDKINIFAQVDAHFGTRVKQASWLSLTVPTLNPVVKNREETERSFVQCRPFSRQLKSLKCLALEELESPLAASRESRSVDSKSVDDWKNDRLLQEVGGYYDLYDISNADETVLFFRLQPSRTLTF
jgi:hypothetical protein